MDTSKKHISGFPAFLTNIMVNKVAFKEVTSDTTSNCNHDYAEPSAQSCSGCPVNKHPGEQAHPKDIVLAKYKNFLCFQYIATRVIQNCSDMLKQLDHDEERIRAHIVETLANNLLIDKKEYTVQDIADFDNNWEAFISNVDRFTRTRLLQCLCEHYLEKQPLENYCTLESETEIPPEIGALTDIVTTDEVFSASTAKQSSKFHENAEESLIEPKYYVLNNEVNPLPLNGTEHCFADAQGNHSVLVESGCYFINLLPEPSKFVASRLPKNGLDKALFVHPHRSHRYGAARIRCAQKLREFREKTALCEQQEPGKQEKESRNEVCGAICTSDTASDINVSDDSDSIPEYVCSLCVLGKNYSKLHKKKPKKAIGAGRS